MEFDKLAEANKLENTRQAIKREMVMWKTLNSKEDFGIRVADKSLLNQYRPIQTLLPYEFFDRFKAEAIAALTQMLEETEAKFKAL